MAFSDPITVTINSVAKTLVRLNQDSYSSEYFLKEATGEITVKIRNTSFQRDGQTIDRHNVELTQTIYATATVPSFTRKAYTVIENSRSDTFAEVVFAGLALAGFTNSANLTKLVNRES
jgi:hypothetical protein